MARYLIGRGVPEDHVVREDQSRTTEEEPDVQPGDHGAVPARYRCIIVTSNYMCSGPPSSPAASGSTAR